MQDSLESTIRKLVKDAVREALLEVRESFEFASRQHNQLRRLRRITKSILSPVND